MRFGLHDKNLKSFYEEQGFAIITGLLDDEDFWPLKDSMNYVFREAFQRNGIIDDSAWGKESVKGHNGGLPHKALDRLYQEHKADFCSCWDVIRMMTGIHSFSSSNKIIALLKTIGLGIPSLEVFPAMRIDMPFDNDRNISWHQEWRYGFGSLNSATIWIPLTDVAKNMGALRAIPKSHQHGLLKVKPVNKIHLYEVSDERVNLDDFVTVEMEMGELLIFSNFFLHESGENTSDRCRYSIQLRFNDLTCPYFAKRGWPRAFRIANNEDMIREERDFNEVHFTIYR